MNYQNTRHTAEVYSIKIVSLIANLQICFLCVCVFISLQKQIKRLQLVQVQLQWKWKAIYLMVGINFKFTY